MEFLEKTATKLVIEELQYQQSEAAAIRNQIANRKVISQEEAESVLRNISWKVSGLRYALGCFLAQETEEGRLNLEEQAQCAEIIEELTNGKQ